MNLNIEDLSEAQTKVVKAICIHQLDSLNRIINNNDRSGVDLTMFLIENEVSKEELDFQLRKGISNFEKLYNNPEDLRVLSEDDLSMFRHLLANIEKEWATKYPNATKNLWHRLHIIEEVQGDIYESNQMN